MTSRTVINRIVAVALLFAAIYLILSAMRIFKGEYGWMEYTVLSATCILLFIAAFLGLRRRSEKKRAIRSSRDSLLKHFWELRHKREW